jgi:cytidylate kinase
MAIVTISRQMGSLGCQLAQSVADQLGYRLVWRELINQAARRAGAPEMALAAIDELGLLNICPSPTACREYRLAVEQIMEEMASEGNVVIVGRAGQVILRDRPGALHLRIIAPFALRAERVAQRHGVTLESAQAQIEASDRYRASYMRRFYRVRWDNPELYHLVINTGRIPVDQAAMIIRQALLASEFAFSPVLSSLGCAD